MRSFTFFAAVVFFALLDNGYAHTARVFKCPCTFSVSRQVLPNANNHKFDVLVQPLSSASRIPNSKGTNIIEKHSSRNLKISDATRTSSGYHFFNKMHIMDKGLFRVSIRHQNTKKDQADPEYNLELHTSARQVICPVVLEQDQPLLSSPSSRALSGEELVQFAARMNSTQDPRIVGGLFISPTLLPYLVAFQTPTTCSDGSSGCASLCTGTILSGRWAMTAAHCEIQVGSVVLVTSRSNRAGMRTTASRVFPHPSYAALSGGFENIFDIAVVELAVDITGCCTTPPQFMPIGVNPRFPRAGAFVRAAGYGATSEDGSVPDPVPGLNRQVDVPVVRSSTCRAVYGIIDESRQVCAGYFLDGECDSCFGDSGGPLVQYAGSTPILMGVTSFGAGCARAGAPGVYTRPSGHLEWLRSTPAIFTEHTGRVTQKRMRCRRGQFLPFVEGEVSSCVPCPDDQYSAGGPIRECQQCPGTLLRDTRRGNRCSCRRFAGAGRIRAQESCTTCPPGRASRVGQARCLKCRAGSFAPEAGMSECLPCPDAPRGATACESLEPTPGDVL